MFALVLSLQDAEQKPKIVAADQLYDLKPNGDAVKLEPRNVNDFDKSKEYGRVQIVEGFQKMVRHRIFKLDGSSASLAEYYKANKEKRFKAPTRKSIGPIVDDVANFVLKASTRDVNPTTAAKKEKRCATSTANDDIAAKYQKLKNASTSGLGKVSAAAKASGAAASKSGGIASSVGSGGGGDAGAAAGAIMPLQGVAQAATASHEVHGDDSRSAASQTEASASTDRSELLQLQLEMATTLSKYEVALLRIKSLEKEKKDRQLQNNIIERMQALEAKLDLLIEKNSKSEDLDEGKESQVDSLSNLVDEDEVEETEVKIDHDTFIPRSEILNVEKNHTSFRSRLEKLVDVFCQNKPETYGISGFTSSGEAVNKFTPNMVSSVKKILDAMGWKVLPKSTAIRLVKHRISTYVSKARKDIKQTASDPSYTPPESAQVKSPKQENINQEEVEDVGQQSDDGQVPAPFLYEESELDKSIELD